MGDNDPFCFKCGAEVKDQQSPSQPGPQPYQQRTYSSGTYSAGGRPRKNNRSTIIAVAAVVVGLILILTWVLPDFVNVEDKPDYSVSVTISNVSINDADNGFQYAEKDTGGRLHTYLMYKDYKKDGNVHELGWCKPNGSVMDITGHNTLSIDVKSSQSKVVLTFSLVVVTKTINGENHYDEADIFDDTGNIISAVPAGDHQYGTSGVVFTLTTDTPTYMFELKGDSKPVGTMTLGFTLTKK